MNKKDKKPFDGKQQRHGYWELYSTNGNLFYKGNFFHDKQSGYWEWFHTKTGKILYKRYYIL